MKRSLVVVIAGLATPAAADRRFEVTTTGGVVATQPAATLPKLQGPFSDPPPTPRGASDDYDPYPTSYLLELALSWEPNPFVFGASARINDAWLEDVVLAVAPEVAVAMADQRATLAVGARFEVNNVGASRTPGPPAMLGSRMWLAPRLGVREGAASPVVGLVYGAQFPLGRTVRLGLEFTGTFWREADLVCNCLSRVVTKPDSLVERPIVWWSQLGGGFSLGIRL